jgi:hypothetical protein
MAACRCAPAPRCAAPLRHRRAAHGLCSDSLSASGRAKPRAVETTCPGTRPTGPARMEGGHHLQVVLGDEAADRQFALHHHGQRRRLHAAHGELFVVGQRVGAREVHAHQPVGPAAAARGVGQRVVVGGPAQRVEALADGLRVSEEIHRRLTGLSHLRGLVDVAEDQLALAAGVGGAHHARDLGRVEDLADHLELVLGLLVDHQRPLSGSMGSRWRRHWRHSG